MSHIVGRGRYARETYPKPPAAGNGPQASSVVEVRFPIGTAAAQTSAASIPNGAVVGERYLAIDTPYSPGTTIEVGNAGSPSLLMATTDSVPTSDGVYSVPADDTVWPGPAAVLVTVGGAPAVGSGFVVVQYVAVPQP